MIEKERVFGFSDGVFAIASTLLVININTQTLQNAFLAGNYSDFFQQIFSYAISFLIIASYWISYHRFFNYIKKIDTPLLWLNIFLLMLVAFIPFPTSLINTHSPHQNAQILYALSLGSVGLILTGMWIYAFFKKKMLFIVEMKTEVITFNIIRLSFASAVFYLSIIVSFFSVSAAMYSWLLIFFARIFMRPFYKKEPVQQEG